MLAADSLCIDGFFPVCCGFFSVIHSLSFVHHSSMFRVVDVLCAVSYAVAEDEWIFSYLLLIFFCVSWSTPCSSLSDPWCYLQTLCVSADCFLSITDFFLLFTPGYMCISPLCSE